MLRPHRHDDDQEHELLPGAAGGKFTASHARDTRAPWAGPGRGTGAVKKNSLGTHGGGYLLLPDRRESAAIGPVSRPTGSLPPGKEGVSNHRPVAPAMIGR
ncbi:hypothetical protein [Streptomyces misionensis]|uniref:hypothetical protein n=1 Tax=Streptomyces misionensis TaxID=67331 RepID=UPI0033A74328